jgi:hypothetical protein
VLGARLLELNALFERSAWERGFYSEQLVGEIARAGGVRDLEAVPQDVRRAFVTALEVTPEWHRRMQAAFQRSVDAAVAKTVNLPASATVDDVWSLYLRAWRLGLKGITVYRYGSRPQQVLEFLGRLRARTIPARAGQPRLRRWLRRPPLRGVGSRGGPLRAGSEGSGAGVCGLVERGTLGPFRRHRIRRW